MKKLLFLLLALTLVLAACGGGQSSTPAPAEKPAENSGQQEQAADVDVTFDFLTIATGGTSGVYYPLGGALGTLYQDKLGAETSVQATQASVENVNLVLSGRAELALITGDTGFQAYEGSGPFEGEGPKEDLRAMAAFYPNYVQIITTESTGIKTFSDLKGKKVGVGAPNSGTELNARLMFEAHGMSYDDITPDYLSFAEAVEQMKNGLVDAAILSSGLPNSAIMDLETTHGVIIIPIEADAMKYLTEKYSFIADSAIPAGTYGNEADVPAAAIINTLIASKDLTEDQVYVLTKTLFENLDAMRAAHSAANDITLENATQGIGIPLHPGAEKYYKEQGVIK